MDETRTMRVGAVAEAAGLTVRTLHHWDSIGLLSPSERSPAGHREYTRADLVRLYQVLALRSLGLGLESIAVCLDAGSTRPAWSATICPRWRRSPPSWIAGASSSVGWSKRWTPAASRTRRPCWTRCGRARRRRHPARRPAGTAPQ